MAKLGLNGSQTKRIQRIVNEYHADKVVIEPSEDDPSEVNVDFRTNDGTQEGVITQYGSLTTYKQ